MQNGPSYRVYTPNELHCLAPSALRGAPPPRARSWFALGFVLVVGLVVGGSSLAALRYFDVDLTTARTALAQPPPPATQATPTLPVPEPLAAATPAPAADEGTPSTSARRKPRGHRRSTAPATSRPSALDLPRAPVVTPRAPSSAPRPVAAPATLPPNPF
ncbi:MAG TPA: hypothetical protein VLT33_29885 [Labilithrix sp.]|nr:hypothetical protein [Labilithrix sp.]